MNKLTKGFQAAVRKKRVKHIRKLATGPDGTSLFIQAKNNQFVTAYLKNKKGVRLPTVLGGSEEARKRCYVVTFDSDHNASYHPVPCSQPHNLAIYDD